MDLTPLKLALSLYDTPNAATRKADSEGSNVNCRELVVLDSPLLLCDVPVPVPPKPARVKRCRRLPTITEDSETEGGKSKITVLDHPSLKETHKNPFCTLFLPPGLNHIRIVDTDLCRLRGVANRSLWQVDEPLPIEQWTADSPSYKLTTKSSIHQTGVLAARDIKAGEVILFARPILLLESTQNDLRPSEDFLKARLDFLSDESREEFLSLYFPPEEEEKKLSAIIQTNALPLCALFDDGQYKGVYPLASRFNHSCKPSAIFSSAEIDMGLLRITALRDIEQNEEITISYLETPLVFEERQKVLRDRGFDCACWLCSSSLRDRSKSDQRRVVIASFAPFIESQWKLEPAKRFKGAEFDKKIRSFEAAYKKEDIVFPLVHVYTQAALLDDRGKNSPWFKVAKEALEGMKAWDMEGQFEEERQDLEDIVSFKALRRIWEAAADLIYGDVQATETEERKLNRLSWQPRR